MLAALSAMPALYGTWQGMQKETQESLGMALLLVFASLAVGAVLILLRVVDWLR
jgi:TRAP-type C4-dicarboxylate transport system permease small subunit